MEKILQVAPKELSFHLELNKPLVQTLKLKNISEETLSFKVKTTQPKRYFVKPNAAIIGAGKEIQVSIVLQPLQELPPDTNSCRDKFLLQVIKVDKGVESDVQSLWKNVSPESLYQQKFRVSFVAGDSPSQDDLKTKKSDTSIASTSSNPEDNFESLKAENIGNLRELSSNATHMEKDSKGVTDAFPGNEVQNKLAETGTISKTTSPVSGSVDELNIEERYQLALDRIGNLLKEKQTYEAELAKLRSSLDEQMNKDSEPTFQRKNSKNKLSLSYLQIFILLVVSFLVGKIF
ncbi:Uncharacterized protein Gasu2_40960 [Galdieria sulphuraria]|uniref:Vesicle-associated membrane protein-associated protein A n=1 Tax=Galdieria sulphuraria TaxID=130081 RepID=M2W825_GALSU|nr:vesicle-associated membrane protein-associated protein A [Galdieria sulphuraria]EME32006.1 vesicle-associated membrane protein-associated protein A [Galdieria sulphuraria]GJD09873.1 Uncharacterized protein Gasu2_40960 [Galdieria sulphuraria]|eukprot:XP_005708526.1 vesicle-associated membrane protein-associated protein A [Galdieria sulphuraria]